MTHETSCFACTHNIAGLWCAWGNDETLGAVMNGERLCKIEECDDFTSFEADD